MQQNEIGPIIKDDEIDLVALVKTIWAGRKIIFYTVGVGVLIGLILAFTLPSKYTATATLLPSAEKKSGSLGGLSALAGMAGINIGAMMGDASGIPSDIYPQVVQSYPFLNELIHQKFNFQKFPNPVSYYDYKSADTVESVGDKVMKYTLRLPWTLKAAIFGGGEKKVEIKHDYGVVKLEKEEASILRSAGQTILVAVDKKSGLITVSATEREPILTAQFVQKAVDLLQKYVIEYKTTQVRQNLDFVQQSYDDAKAEYEEAQRSFFSFKDSHRNIVAERTDLEYQRLSDSYDMASAVFKGLAQQLEQARIAVKEETPAFTVLEPAKIPLEKSAPKKSMVMIISVFMGGFVGLGIIFGKIAIREYFK